MTNETTPNTTAVAEEVRASEPSHSGQFYRPVVDIVETPEEILLHADMPGAKSDAIDVQFEDGSLTIHARIHERAEEGRRYLLNEYGVGDFYRTFKVSEHVDASRISADYVDGVLTLHLPKVEAMKPRKIAVQAK